MRSMNSLPLDDDIIDYVLASLPDYATLRVAILSSKSVYNVFKAHPKAIIRAISYNVTGPSLPQAIRLLRYKTPTKASDQTSTHKMDFWSEDDDIGLITGEECCQLAKDATIVKGLEDLFSLRHKDRTSHTSVLNYVESLRFRRAIYRLMLVAKIFPADDYKDEDEDDEDFDPAVLEHDRLARKELLDGFATSELFELHSASLFLIEIAKGICAGESGQPDEMPEDLVLARGPVLVLKAYRSITTDDLRSDIVPPSLLEYLSNPLKRIWEERKSKPSDNSSHWRSLLDDIRGSNDTCDKCGTTCGLDLWNESSWDHLRRSSFSLGPHGVLALVKGRLITNIIEGSSLKLKLLSVYSPPYPNLLEQMHRVKTSPWATWNNGNWLCEPCIVELFRTHLHFWFLELKREGGDEIKEDCWYGYNCRTQTHSVHHAGRLNHLCEPTR